jgi:carbamoylphosphate synthase large subunit
MKKALLIDSGFSAIPIYKAIKNEGYEVHTVGNRESDPLALINEYHHLIDYSKIEIVRDLVNTENIDVLIPGCTDLSYKIASELDPKNTKLRIDTLDQHIRINDKKLFRALCQQLDIPTPNAYESFPKISQWPVIVKPADSFSGKGITVVHKGFDEYNTAVELATFHSPTNNSVTEDFISGDLYSYSAFLEDNRIVSGFFVKEYCTTNPYVVDTSYVVEDTNESWMNTIKHSITKISKELDLNDGLLHTQFIVDQEKAFIIEATRRCPGDLYSELIQLSTGYEYVKSYVKKFLGEKLQSSTPFSYKKVLRHTISSRNNIPLEAIQFKKDVNLIKLVPIKKVGEEFSSEKRQRCAVLFLKFTSKSNLKSTVLSIIDKNLYSTSL